MVDFLDRLQAALADRYVLEIDSAGYPRELGRGGMAAVYLAQDLKHNRVVALKVLHPDLAQALGAERFLREIEIASQLSHPHILPLYDSGGAEGLLYYVMPYVAGESLRQRLTRERQLPVEVAIRLAGEIGRALDYAHQQGVIHRDIKPENILLQDQQALVADFGISRAISGSLKQGAAQKLTETGLTLGTPQYMSPEQASGDRQLDGRSDLYSLGCVVYEMLTGEPPFNGPSAQAVLARHVLDPVPPLRTVRSAVPEHTERAVKRALGKVPADRFDNAEDFAQALLTPGPLPAFQPTKMQRRLRPPARRKLALGLGVVAVFAVGAGGLLSGRVNRSMLEPNLVAVAPFDVVDPKLALWREGLVDYLTKNLDGAGHLRAVPPSVVLQRWKGRADPGSAQELGRRSGAGVVIFGNLSPAGKDSVRVRATVLNAGLKSPVAEFEGLDQLDRVDRLADSLTLEVLRALGDTATDSPTRITAVGTRSIPALKAYLKGEQYYRRAVNDSAEVHFSRAVALDTTFALAINRLATVRGWGELQTIGLYVRAAQFNRGLSPKDSMLIVIDSLRAAASGIDNAYWSHRVRMLEFAQGVSNGNGEDPEAARVFAELLYHFEDVVGSTWWKGEGPFTAKRQFDRAIELDSGFSHIYFHPIQLAGDPARARPYIEGYLQAVGPHGGSSGVRLLARLIDPARTHVEPLDSAPTNDLGEVISLTRTWQDSSELALRLALVYAARPDVHGGPDIPELRGSWRRGFQRHYPAEILAYRGHFKEARRLTGAEVSKTFVDLALMGAIPADTASALVAAWLREPRVEQVHPSWWATRHDTARLVARLASEEKGARIARGPYGCDDARCQWANGLTPPDVASMQSAPALTRVHLALARADTADALRRVLALPDSVFAGDWRVRLLEFQLLAAAGRDGEAAAVFDPLVLPPTSPLWVLGTLERGRVAERRSQRDPEAGTRGIERFRAAECYQFVADVWRHADPELQPHVAEARAGLERLGPSDDS
jgi:tRNA A-37 threonylcarbamoyl transferase component Bud32